MIHLLISSLIIKELSFHVIDFFFGFSDHSLIMMLECQKKKRKEKKSKSGLINFYKIKNLKFKKIIQ